VLCRGDAPRGAAGTITVVAVIVVGGWAVVGPGGRGQLHIRQQGGEHRDWTAKEEISTKKKKKKNAPAEGKPAWVAMLPMCRLRRIITVSGGVMLHPWGLVIGLKKKKSAKKK
jgi:hypothetical protein